MINQKPSIFLLYLVITFLIPGVASAQQHTVNGKVVNKEQQPLVYVNASLLKNDTVFVEGMVTDSLGAFHFKVDKGNYKLILEQFGTEFFNQRLEINQDIDLGKIKIDEAILLEGVTITARKKIIEQKVDRLVFNVENAVSASVGNALDALKSTPLVRVQNDNVSIVGKGGVLVMIDDRLQRLSPDDLANLLKSIASDNIKSIEVITTPPAKYDAEGSNGLINIVLKKGRKNSWSASLGTSYVQKRNAGGGVNGVFNYNYNKVSLQASLNTNTQKLLTESESAIFYPDELWNLNVKNHSLNKNLGASFGIDYKIKDNWTTGLKYLGSFTDDASQNNPLTSRYANSSSVAHAYIASDVSSENNSKINSVNWFNKIKTDSLGTVLTTDFDYFKYNKTDDLSTMGNELDSNKDTIPLTYFSSNNTNINKVENYSGKADVEMPRNWGNLSFGGKFSATKTDNDLTVFNNETGVPVLDTNQSNIFQYKEYIEAVYASFSKKLSEKWDLQLGLRLEATQTEGYSKNINQRNKNNYTKLFPTVFVTYLPNDNHSFSFNYSRRIVRPSFDYLNPFIIKPNPYFYTEGNPFLEPMIQDNIELSHLYKERLGVRLYYNIVAGFAQRVSIGDTETNITRSVPLNYANSGLTGISAYYIFNTLKWWNSFTGFNVNYQKIHSKSEYIQSIGGFNGFFYSTNEFFTSSSKNVSFGANLWVQPNGLNQIFNISTFYGLDISAKLKLLNKNLTLTAVVEDVFDSQRPTYTYYTNGIKNTRRRYNDTRGFQISLIYRFGNKEISKVQRNSGNEDERRRTN